MRINIDLDIQPEELAAILELFNGDESEPEPEPQGATAQVELDYDRPSTKIREPVGFHADNPWEDDELRRRS